MQDAESREYYQMFDTRWEDMKKYKKEFLKVVQRQMFQHGHQMFIQNVETEVEEMFWADPNIHILHQQFAAKYIAGFEVRGAIRKRLGWRWATAVPGVSTSGCAGSLGPFLRQPELRALPPAGAQHQAVRGQAQEREELDQSRRSQSAGFAASRSLLHVRLGLACFVRAPNHLPARLSSCRACVSVGHHCGPA